MGKEKVDVDVCEESIPFAVPEDVGKAKKLPAVIIINHITCVKPPFLSTNDPNPGLISWKKKGDGKTHKVMERSQQKVMERMKLLEEEVLRMGSDLNISETLHGR